jgi:hypothetical protein
MISCTSRSVMLSGSHTVDNVSSIKTVSMLLIISSSMIYASLDVKLYMIYQHMYMVSSNIVHKLAWCWDRQMCMRACAFKRQTR